MRYLVDGATIAEVHGEFMDHATSTDVITFHNGRNIVSLDTARRERPNHTVRPEMKLCFTLLTNGSIIFS